MSELVHASASPSAIPAGIGPEIARKAAADPRVLAHSARSSSTDRRMTTEVARFEPRPRARPRPVARRTMRSLPRRRDAQAGRIDAIATAPINKEAFAAAGMPWRGHTELLAHLTGAPRVAMMFYAEALRVVLATVHIPLADVSRRADARAARGDHRSGGARNCRGSAIRRRGSRSPD